MKNKILLGLVTAVLLLSMTFMVSAIDVKYSDSYLPKEKSNSGHTGNGQVVAIQNFEEILKNAKQKDLIKNRYPKVTISNDGFLGLFSGSEIMNIELIDNTDFCNSDCYSLLKVQVKERTSILDGLKIKKDGISGYTTNDLNTQIYILKNLSRTIEVNSGENSTTCKNEFRQFSSSRGENGVEIENKKVLSLIEVCESVPIPVNKLEWYQEYQLYNNEQLDPGTYYVKITGKKKFGQGSVDWVPTIKGMDIEALAWWNSTTLYGNGTLGNVYFTVPTKNYGNMTVNDYSVSGNTLYLKTDRVYDFNSLYLGPGTILSTQNTTGAVIYLMAKENITIDGTINLTGALMDGSFNSTSFSYVGDTFTTPSVAAGGHGGGNYGNQNGGYGGGGGSYEWYTGSVYTPLAGATGGFPFGSGGGGGSATSTRDGDIFGYGSAGTIGSGGAGATMCLASDEPTMTPCGSSGNTYGCTISCTGGTGGNSYGAGGGAGTGSGSHQSSWLCCSGAGGFGGSGAGGRAGKSGINLVLKAKIVDLGSTAILSTAGTSGQAGGTAGNERWYNWQSNSWTLDHTSTSGGGGGGGGGGNGGNIKIYYKYLYNDTSLTTIGVMTGGAGGTAGTGLYNAVAGNTGSTGSLSLNRQGFTELNLLQPLNNTQVVIPAQMPFVASLTPYSVTLVNATMNLWFGGTLNYTNTTVLSGTSPINVTWYLPSTFFVDGVYSWGMTACWTDGSVKFCDSTQNNTFQTFSVQFGTSSYNSPVYEMTNQTYSINVTSTGFVNLTGTLVWNGVEYPATTTGNNVNATFTRTIWIPTGVGQKQFHWHILYGGALKESSPENVTVLNSIWAICNSTNNVTFFSVNYKDETTNLPINATIVQSSWNYNISGSPYGEQYLYSVPVVNGTQATSLTHNFCFTPPDASIIITDSSYQYGNPLLGYSTKIWNWQVLPLTNSTTTTTLYLINLVDSGTSPVTFQALSAQTNVVLEGIRIQVYRTINGNPTLVDDGFTDTAGTISYYLSPITAYTVVASGGNCNQLTSTITPTSSQYNIVLNCQGSFAAQEFTTPIDGLTYTRTPADGVSTPGTNTYTFNVYSTKNSMSRVKFQLIDARTRAILAVNDSLTNVAGCNATSCGLSLVYTTYTGDNIKGLYYVAINGTNDSNLVLIEGDAYWRFIKINQNNSVNAIGRLMLQLQDFFGTWGTAATDCGPYTTKVTCEAVPECKWVNETVWAPKESNNYQEPVELCIPKDDYNKAEFNRIFTIFFILAIVLFILGRTTGYELNHPGAFVVAMSAIIWILSLYGMFTFNGLTQYPFFNQYIFALITSCIGAGYGISVIRRYSG